MAINVCYIYRPSLRIVDLARRYPSRGGYDFKAHKYNSSIQLQPIVCIKDDRSEYGTHDWSELHNSM